MHSLKINICLIGNLHVGSGFGFARIIDNTVIKDSKGIVYIPASTIKGKLRSVCRKIALTLNDRDFLNSDGKICGSSTDQFAVCTHDEIKDRCAICRLFGSTFSEGKLIFTDSTLSQDKYEEITVLSKISRFMAPSQSEVQMRVKLSRHRRVSDPRHLFAFENVPGNIGTFSGLIYIRTPLTPSEKRLLKYAMKAITHLGGQKSKGSGRIVIKLEGNDALSYDCNTGLARLHRAKERHRKLYRDHGLHTRNNNSRGTGSALYRSKRKRQ